MAGQVKTKHLKGCMCHANVIEVGVRNCIKGCSQIEEDEDHA